MFAGLDLLGMTSFWLAFFAAVLMAAFAGLVPGISATLLMALAYMAAFGALWLTGIRGEVWRHRAEAAALRAARA